jgi:hypothetical protein
MIASELAGLELEATAILEEWGNEHKGIEDLTSGARASKDTMGKISIAMQRCKKQNGFKEINLTFKILRDEKYGTILPMVRATLVK